MTNKEHQEIHKDLHDKVDTLLADFIIHANKLPSKTTILEFIKWSYKQTVQPDHDEDLC